MGKRFVLNRVSSPVLKNYELQSVSHCLHESRNLTGDQYDWGWALPAPFRALANPFVPTAFPRKPDYSKDFEGAQSYWLSLQQLLMYRLGWSHPGLGMAQLLDLELLRENPEQDDTVRLIKELWFEDGYIKHYLDWALAQHDSFQIRRRTLVPAVTKHFDDEMQASYHTHSPKGLHLEAHGGHYFSPGIGPVPAGDIVAVDPEARTATVIIEDAWGWYESLCQQGERLPPINGRSISVDVYVKPIGFMGAYRQSRVTGLWFTGSHSIHMLGNVER